MSYSNDSVGSLYGVDKLTVLRKLIEVTRRGLVKWEVKHSNRPSDDWVEGQVGPYKLELESWGRRLWIHAPEGSVPIKRTGGEINMALDELWHVAHARAAPTELVRQFYEYLSSVEDGHGG